MTSLADDDLASVLDYALRVQNAVESADDDTDLIARVAQFDGGSTALLTFLAEGMALAFDPSRSQGEIGTVHFVVGLPSEDVDIWMRLHDDRCEIRNDGDDPDAVVWLALPVFLRIAFKRIEAADAYLAGDVEAVGDVVLATSLDDWFAPPVLTIRGQM